MSGDQAVDLTPSNERPSPALPTLPVEPELPSTRVVRLVDDGQGDTGFEQPEFSEEFLGNGLTTAASTNLLTIAGRIFDGDYEPWAIRGATIAAAGGPSATSDAKGKFTLRIKRGTYRFTIKAAGYKTISARITIDPGDRLEGWLEAIAPKGASARCKDKTWSSSRNRSGTCSSHRGVAYWLCPGPLCR
jgi:hypothetical protein